MNKTLFSIFPEELFKPFRPGRWFVRAVVLLLFYNLDMLFFNAVEE